jgi:hypothetical protein
MKDIYVLCLVENGNRQLLGAYENVNDAKWNVAELIRQDRPDNHTDVISTSLTWEACPSSSGHYPMNNPTIMHMMDTGTFIIEVLTDAPVVDVLKMQEKSMDRRFVGD